ncbi:hypothetical protein AN214_01301 [Pseudoalteromonas sp. P1-9]|uniref:hypothetical protein n=1 Tax=Pseudoalteromonas sp. P1-9 TaxID=1710354 RepID=UPI0006D5D05D|nr:hypothetical protein [Pseudoalteromonas sp. P1-9]KPV96840.1 hypothetical protein AN214_01301 [Pseudoalteromonas sp. P1-9]
MNSTLTKLIVLVFVLNIGGCYAPANMYEYIEIQYKEIRIPNLAIIAQLEDGKQTNMFFVSFSTDKDLNRPIKRTEQLDASQFNRLGTLEADNITLTVFAKDTLKCADDAKVLLTNVFNIMESEERSSGFNVHQTHHTFLTDDEVFLYIDTIGDSLDGLSSKPIQSLQYLECGKSLLSSVLKKVQGVVHEATHIEVALKHKAILKDTPLDRLTDEFIAVKSEKCFTHYPPKFQHKITSEGISNKQEQKEYLLNLEESLFNYANDKSSYQSMLAAHIFIEWHYSLQQQGKGLLEFCDFDLSSSAYIENQRELVKSIIDEYEIPLR